MNNDYPYDPPRVLEHPYWVAGALWLICWSLWLLDARLDRRWPRVVLGLAFVLGGLLAWLRLHDPSDLSWEDRMSGRYPSLFWHVLLDGFHGLAGAVGAVSVVARLRAGRLARL
jgi:hypothetical protein